MKRGRGIEGLPSAEQAFGKKVVRGVKAAGAIFLGAAAMKGSGNPVEGAGDLAHDAGRSSEPAVHAAGEFLRSDSNPDQTIGGPISDSDIDSDHDGDKGNDATDHPAAPENPVALGPDDINPEDTTTVVPNPEARPQTGGIQPGKPEKPTGGISPS